MALKSSPSLLMFLYNQYIWSRPMQVALKFFLSHPLFFSILKLLVSGCFISGLIVRSPGCVFVCVHAWGPEADSVCLFSMAFHVDLFI